MKQFLRILSLMMFFGAMAMAVEGSGASEALDTEVIGMTKTLGTILFVVLILAYIGIPIGAAFFSASISKKQAKQDGDEAGGVKSMIWTAAGGIMGFFAMFIIVGFLGHMMNEENLDSTEGINLTKGNVFVISKVLGSLLTNTETKLQAK